MSKCVTTCQEPGVILLGVGHRSKVTCYDQIKIVTILRAIAHHHYEWKANSLHYNTASKEYSYGYQVFSFTLLYSVLQKFDLKTDKEWHVVVNIMPFHLWGNTGCVEIKWQFQSQSMAYQWQQKITVPFSQQFCTLSLKWNWSNFFLWTNTAYKV